MRGRRGRDAKSAFSETQLGPILNLLRQQQASHGKEAAGQEGHRVHHTGRSQISASLLPHPTPAFSFTVATHSYLNTRGRRGGVKKEREEEEGEKKTSSRRRRQGLTSK